MDIDAMREAIKKPYSKSKTWAFRVDQMQNKQIIAIYAKFLYEGKFTEVRESEVLSVQNYLDDGVQLEMNI